MKDYVNELRSALVNYQKFVQWCGRFGCGHKACVLYLAANKALDAADLAEGKELMEMRDLAEGKELMEMRPVAVGPQPAMQL